MAQNNLAQMRLDDIESVKAGIESLTDYYNDSFAGNSTMRRQNDAISQMLDLIPQMQALLLHIREYNSQLVVNHQVEVKAKQMRALQSAYEQVTKAVSQANSVLALEDSSSADLIDNTKYTGSIGIDDGYSDTNDSSKDSEPENFSQPGASSAAASVNSDYTQAGHVESAIRSAVNVESARNYERNDDYAVSARNQSEEADVTAKAHAGAIQSQPTEPVEHKAEPRQSFTRKPEKVQPVKFARDPQESQAEVDSVKQPSSFNDRNSYQRTTASIKKEVSPARQVVDKVAKKPAAEPKADQVQSGEAEFEAHQERAQEAQSSKKDSKISRRPGMAIKWPGQKGYITKDGRKLPDDDDQPTVRDVTPVNKKKANHDQSLADDLLSKEIDNL